MARGRELVVPPLEVSRAIVTKGNIFNLLYKFYRNVLNIWDVFGVLL